jgi:hypothetical protein
MTDPTDSPSATLAPAGAVEPAAEGGAPPPGLPPLLSGAGTEGRGVGSRIQVPALQRSVAPARQALEPACGDDADCGCGKAMAAGPAGFVYAMGTVTGRFPNQSLEQEFRAAWGSTAYNGPITQADLYRVLSQGQNLYIARDMCWVFQVENVDVYLTVPRSYVELSDLILALAPTPGEVSAALIVGVLGPMAPPSACNGLVLPVVTADQVFYFTFNAFIDNIVAQAAREGKDVTKEAAVKAFYILQQMADNNGHTDEYRAINFIAFRNLDIYVKETQMEQESYQLATVQAQPSLLTGTRRIVDVIFIYNNTVSNSVQRFFARVDVTGEWPFLVTGIQPYFDHP